MKIKAILTWGFCLLFLASCGGNKGSNTPAKPKTQTKTVNDVEFTLTKKSKNIYDMKVYNKSANTITFRVSGDKNCDLKTECNGYHYGTTIVKSDTFNVEIVLDNSNVGDDIYVVFGDDKYENAKKLHMSFYRFSPREDHQVVEFKNKMYVIGGKDYAGNTTKDIWSSTDGNTWQKIDTNSSFTFTAITDHQLVVFKDQLHIIGGSSDGTATSTVWSSSDGVKWTSTAVTQLPAARKDHQAIVFKDNLYVIGGTDGTNLQDNILTTSDGKKWTSTQVVESSVVGHQAVVFKNKLYIISGLTTTNTVNTDPAVVASTSDGKAWTTTATTITAFTQREGHQALVYKDELYVIGGNNGSNTADIKNDVYKTSDGKTWEAVTTSPTVKITDHQAIVFNKDIYIIGGRGEKGDALNEVWKSSDGKKLEKLNAK